MKGSIKDKVYALLVDRNPDIKQAYESKILQSTQTHQKYRIASWCRLFWLNIKYFFVRNTFKTVSEGAKDNNSKKNTVAVMKPESEKVSPPTYLHYAKGLQKRTSLAAFSAMNLLFYLPFSELTAIYKLLARNYNILSFPETRVKAEQLARERAFVEHGTYAVSIYDIYQIIEEYTGIPTSDGVQNEFQLILSFIRPVEYFKRTLELLNEKDTQIIIVEESIWSAEQITQMLVKCGYTEKIKEIYTSSDCRCSKDDGTLYKYIDNIYPNKEIVMVNYDKEHAENVKMISNWYSNLFVNVNDIACVHRIPADNSLILSSYAGVVNQIIYNKCCTFSPHFEFGLLYGGYFFLSYCFQLEKKAVENEAEMIVFLSTESDFLLKIYNKHFGSKPTKELFLSNSLVALSILLKDGIAFVEYVINTAIIRDNTIFKVLQELGLTSFLPEVELHGLEMSTQIRKIESGHIESLSRFLTQHLSEIQSFLMEEFLIAKPYLHNIFDDYKRILIADTNLQICARYSIAELLHQLMQKTMDIQVYSIDYTHGYAPYAKCKDVIHRSSVYMQEHFQGRKDSRFKSAFDILMTGKYQGIVKLSKDSKFYLQVLVQDATKLKAIQEIQDGILCYCDAYTEIFEDYNELLLVPEIACRIVNHAGSKKFIW